ncbi:hypothetical protein Lal_00037106, partial [Lupinus albus]
PVAEECGAISAIGDWVLEHACREAVLWNLQPRIAVNLSALQLSNAGLVEKVRAVLAATGLPAHRLELEVTETALIADRDRALYLLQQLKAMGVTIAMDDFGSGYSSLETLRSFPFDKIKLDRSFISELETSQQAKAFVRAILALGHSLNVAVLAEGVETEAQRAILEEEGCQEGQGYLFGYPALLTRLASLSMSQSLSLAADAAPLAPAEEAPGTGPLAALAELLQSRRQVLVLTGAGISTASGIPDYRDDSGVRRGRLPIQGTEFRQSDAARKRYWARSMLGWPRLAQAAPNAAHRALAQLQRAGHLGGILTQNVDGLHQQAGSRDVIELHGSIHAVRCLACDTVYPRAEIQQELARCNPSFVDLQAEALPDGDARLEPQADAAFHVPACVACGGMLQPDVVFFGDGVPPARTAQ